MKKSGIYSITNKVNGKRYYGSSTNLHRRKIVHWSELRGNIHCNKHLQAAWNKYGEDAFSFEVVEYAEPECLLDVEATYIKDNDGGYNIGKVAGMEMYGRKHTPEAIEKIRLASIGRKHSEESRKRQSLSMTGKKRGPHKPETILKIGEAQTGSKNHRFGKKWDDEHKQLFRESMVGNQHARKCI